MVIKSGRFGKFAACPNYPNCKNTKPLDSTGKAPAEKTADENKVADIMREEFTMAEIDDPAVKLAKIFLQTNLPQLIIVDTDGKPAGMITLKNFSAKLFWD